MPEKRAARPPASGGRGKKGAPGVVVSARALLVRIMSQSPNRRENAPSLEDPAGSPVAGIRFSHGGGRRLRSLHERWERCPLPLPGDGRRQHRQRLRRFPELPDARALRSHPRFLPEPDGQLTVRLRVEITAPRNHEQESSALWPRVAQMKSPIRRWLIALSAVASSVMVGYLTRTEWCIRQLDMPIFKDTNLVGEPDRIVAKLGKPARRLQLKPSSPARNDLFLRLFWREDRVRLGGREVDLLLWEQRCSGSTIWQFAVATDATSGRILAVGGDSSFYRPVYLVDGTSKTSGRRQQHPE